jgi:hypothetical protein
MLVLPREFAQIMQEIGRAPAYSRIRSAAERYVTEKLPAEHNTLSEQTRVASLFARACRDFLIIDSGGNARQYQAQAQALRAALHVLSEDDGRAHFDSLMLGADDAGEALTVDAPAGERGPVRIRSRSAEQARWALDEMAGRLEQIGQDFAKDRKNITPVFCVCRRFSAARLPLPSASQVLEVWRVLVEAVNHASPMRLAPDQYAASDIGRLIRHYKDRDEAGT